MISYPIFSNDDFPDIERPWDNLDDFDEGED